MMKRITLIMTLMCFVFGLQAQDITVDEILNNYYENTGGKDTWNNLKGIKMMAKVNQQGMEFPLEIVVLSDGKQYTKVTFQGQIIMQGVFDGSVLWNTNFQTMQAEKADNETTENQKLDSNDFPDSFLNYKDKGYTAELVGTETVEGTETYKVKLVKEPRMLDGTKVEDISYYYFDTENFVPIVQESEIKMGPMKGQIQQIISSDYQEVEGLYFPFTMSQGVKGAGSQPIVIESIVLNPEVDQSVFAFPAPATAESEGK